MGIRKLLEALFRNYFYVPCDRRYYDYSIRQRTLERTLPSFDFILLPSLQIEQCDKLRYREILVIGIRRWFLLPSLHFPKIEEVCWAARRIQGRKDISISIPFLSGKSALTGAQDISCVQYFQQSQSGQSDWTFYNSGPSTPARESSNRL